MDASMPPGAKKGRSRSNRLAVEADGFRRTREAHARETAEDYVEAIADLAASKGEARVIDLARKFGVTHVTVNRTVARLKAAGFVDAQPYRAIHLTGKGRKVAAQARERHETVVRFLRSLGIPNAVAHRDAEGIEHHVSPKTLAAFEAAARRNARRLT